MRDGEFHLSLVSSEEVVERWQTCHARFPRRRKGLLSRISPDSPQGSAVKLALPLFHDLARGVQLTELERAVAEVDPNEGKKAIMRRGRS